MIQNTMNSIEGVSIYGIISISIFFTFFTGMLLWAFAQKKNHLNHMAELPLADGEKNNNINSHS